MNPQVLTHGPAVLRQRDSEGSKGRPTNRGWYLNWPTSLARTGRKGTPPGPPVGPLQVHREPLPPTMMLSPGTTRQGRAYRASCSSSRPTEFRIRIPWSRLTQTFLEEHCGSASLSETGRGLPVTVALYDTGQVCIAFSVDPKDQEPPPAPDALDAEEVVGCPEPYPTDEDYEPQEGPGDYEDMPGISPMTVV